MPRKLKGISLHHGQECHSETVSIIILFSDCIRNYFCNSDFCLNVKPGSEQGEKCMEQGHSSVHSLAVLFSVCFLVDWSHLVQKFNFPPTLWYPYYKPPRQLWEIQLQQSKRYTMASCLSICACKCTF